MNILTENKEDGWLEWTGAFIVQVKVIINRIKDVKREAIIKYIEFWAKKVETTNIRHFIVVNVIIYVSMNWISYIIF